MEMFFLCRSNHQLLSRMSFEVCWLAPRRPVQSLSLLTHIPMHIHIVRICNESGFLREVQLLLLQCSNKM